MHHLAEISPILGSYTRSPRMFGNQPKARYANHMTGEGLDWNSDNRAGAAVLSPKGRIDESTANAFKSHLLHAITDAPDQAIIDLADVEYMSSRGLRALTLAQRAGQESGTTIVLARPNDTMREILAISRYDMVFRVADTIEDAIGR